jgi:hypothetical protein
VPSVSLTHDLDFKKNRGPAHSPRAERLSKKRIPVGMPRVPQAVRNSAFYLFGSAEDAERGDNSGGSGFIVAVPSERHGKYGHVHHYAVAAWHVAVRGGSPVIRLNTKDGKSDIFEYDVDQWVFDGRHDIAVLPIRLDPMHDVAAIPAKMMLTPEQVRAAEIGPGDDVIMVGRFMDHDGGPVHRPAFRFGNIAIEPSPIMQPNMVRAEAWCIDLHSRTDFSGSPVYVWRTPYADLAPKPAQPTPNVGFQMQPELSTFFMLLGIHIAQFPEKWEATSDGKLSHTSRQPLLAYVEGLGGMTLVLPSWTIRSVLDRPELVQMRAEAEEETEEQFRCHGYPAEPEAAG